ncbi:outer membrane beta-barrel protein [Mucilaginibacter sp. ZT4R22]|uniref:Outer membrane beta-barrel protein n=1 Tax=Mucilaginibacter pankratovii TaxID=2772110 RepID=A0ABR7X0V0_9SPHI|nr:outer membrane beta-barrel protein [Mucilaginibacter pankratovii]MBD1367157.1 outer membrane beta-barrel protein [Mucilaginibacter pankratovii]
MKKLLLSVTLVFACITLFAQKPEVTVGAYSGLFRYSGTSSESVSFINASSDNNAIKSYTNNPYGNKFGIGYGIGGQAQLVGKGGFLVGLQAAYEQLKSKIDINRVSSFVPVSSGPANNFDANGSTALKNNIININPYIGYRIPLAKIKLDILAGTDIGFISSTHEKGSAKGSNGDTYTTDLDRTTVTEDFRLRIGFVASLNKFSLNASYANGISNYMGGYIGGGSHNAHSKVIRIGLGYRIF